MDWKQFLAYITGSVDRGLLLARHRKLVAQKFIGSGQRKRPGRPLVDAGVTRVPLPPRSPNVNAYAERWVHSVKEEALSQLTLVGERSLRHALTEYVAHYHRERPHQGRDNVVLMPAFVHMQATTGGSRIRCRERLSGLLAYYDRAAA